MELMRLRFFPIAIFLFVLSNIQFIHFHKEFGIPLPYIFLFLLITAFLWRNNFVLPGSIHHWSIFALFILFLLASTFMTASYAEGIQTLIDVILGYVLASLLTHKFNLIRFVLSLHYIYTYLIFIFMLDVLSFKYLNTLSFLITDNASGGTATFLPRINVFFSNPNWLASFYFFNCALLYYLTRNIRVLLIGALIIFVLQSKTYIALMILMIIFYQLKNNFLRIVALVCSSFLFFNFFSDPINLFFGQLQETSSVVNRVRIYEYVENTVKIYPSGFLSIGIENLKNYSGEDTVPSIILLAKLFGGFVMALISAAAIYMGWRYYNLVPIMMLIAAFSQSFLAVSGVASVMIMYLCISIKVSKIE